MKTVIRICGVSLAVAVLSGCGVVRSTSALVDARHAYEAAKLVDAEDLAPYEFTLGVEYLRKAKEEAGYSDYQTAEKLARRAKAWLEEARHATMVEGTTGTSVLGSTEEE